MLEATRTFLKTIDLVLKQNFVHLPLLLLR
jgi:hypothetical protein